MAAHWNLLTFDTAKEDTVTGANADEIRIESDENGFVLYIDAAGAEFVFNIHGVAEELWDQCVKQIGPWLLEAQQAKAEYDRAKRNAYPEDDEPWPGESAFDFYKRTGNDEPLRGQADTLNKARKESDA